jgi:hypothetical protein
MNRGSVAHIRRRHDDRIDHHHARSEVGIAPTQLKRNDASQAVADNERLFQTQLSALPGDVVGESHYGVFLLRRIARSVAAKVDGDDAVVSGEMDNLRRKIP